MTAPKFTPGPLSVRIGLSPIIKDATGLMVGKAIPSQPNCLESMAEARANAVLWSAAPDLYEALAAMVAERDRHRCGDTPATEIARAALAKAEGRS